MAADLDPRLNAFRPDLADVQLKGTITAERFVEASPGQISWALVPMRGRPSATAALDNEVHFGERVAVFDVTDGWAWVQLVRDRYVGYVPAAAVSQDVLEPSHRVSALGTFVYPTADIKAPPIMTVPLGAELTIVGSDDRFARLIKGGHVVVRHISPIGRAVRDFVAVAERFIGVPYLWGGRSRIGIDCSGLLQVALEAAGHACPRDSDMQQAALGTDVLIPEDHEGLERGDLVFWKGHAGVMVDGAMLLHANAHHMAVAVEPLSVAVDRIAKAGSPIAAIKRIGASPARA